MLVFQELEVFDPYLGCLVLEPKKRVVFFLNMDLQKTQVLPSLYRLPPAGRFFEKWTSKKHKSWRRCTDCLRRVDFLKHGRLKNANHHRWAPVAAQGSFWVAWGTSQEQVRFWTPFSENKCENPTVFTGLGAARKLKADQANQPDLPEMVQARHFRP